MKPAAKKQRSVDATTEFIYMRVMFDSLESTALRYFFSDNGKDFKTEKFKELKKDLFPIIEKLRKDLAYDGGRDPVEHHCYPNQFHCGDWCVPYCIEMPEQEGSF